MVFLGLTTSDAYNPAFQVVLIVLTAIGLILTPIYLLSMLRQVFYGPKNPAFTTEPEAQMDAKPREVLITACLLLPILGIGLYPKLATQTYDVKTVEVATRIQDSLTLFSYDQQPFYTAIAYKPQPFFATNLSAPSIPKVKEAG